MITDDADRAFRDKNRTLLVKNKTKKQKKMAFADFGFLNKAYLAQVSLDTNFFKKHKNSPKLVKVSKDKMSVQTNFHHLFSSKFRGKKFLFRTVFC